MICALEAQDFEPFGRQHCAYHPGNKPQQYGEGGVNRPIGEHGMPLHKAIKELSIKDGGKKDFWRLKNSSSADTHDVSDEELYVNDHVVVWSKGTSDGVSKIIKSFTVDSPVHEALWCSFLLPIDEQDLTTLTNCDSKTVAAKEQQAICVVQSSTISIFTTDGRDYSTTLPFQISSIWRVDNGLLMERVVSHQNRDVIKTPKKDQSNLPVLFSMMHPLDEATPIICKMGGSAGKVSFVTDTSQQIVFTSTKPSLLVTYDKLLRAHSVWTVRSAKAEEALTALGNTGTDCVTGNLFQQEAKGQTPGLSQSQSGFSRLTISSQSPSCTSPLLRINCSSRMNSPSGTQSKLNSPSLSRLALSHSQSPYRLQTPPPSGKASPAGSLGRTPMSINSTYMEGSFTEVREPLVPEICLDHLWTEGTTSRDSNNGQASSVFLIKDLCGQQYLCYLVTYAYQLRCVKFNESNDKTQLIFGALSSIQARDAIPMQGLDMILVLDMNYHLILYSGTTKINQVHVGGLPDPHGMMGSSMIHQMAHRPSTPCEATPLRLSMGPVTSSRPPSALEARFFNDESAELSPIQLGPNVAPSGGESGSFSCRPSHLGASLVQRLSPVPTEFSDTSQVLDNSFSDDISFHVSHMGKIIAIRDSVNNRFTLELSDGRLFRTALPPLTRSPIIQTCLDAIRQILPKDLAMQVLVRWYSIHNAPGSNSGQSEWQLFVKCLLSMMGYDVEKLALTRGGDHESSLSPVLAVKKMKTSDLGSDEDWENLMCNDLHQAVESTETYTLGLEPLAAQVHSISECSPLDNNAPLFQHFPAILFSLHLVYEELKLDSLCATELEELASLLCQIARDLRCELYTDLYSRDFPDLFAHIGEESLIMDEHFQQMHKPGFFTEGCPSIYQWLCGFIQSKDQLPFPYLYGVSIRTIHVIVMYVSLLARESFKDITWSTYLRKVSTAGHHSPDIEETITHYCTSEHLSTIPHERIVLYMAQLESSLRDSLQYGVMLPLKEAIYRCRDNPPGHWPEQAYILIGREDLAKQKRTEREKLSPISPTRESGPQIKGLKEEEDGMEYMDQELLKLMFPDDLRVQEVRRLLQSSKPVRIAIQQKPEVSDHEYIEEQERHLFATCVRTMALPLGRGMFTLSTYHPVPTETVPMPKLCLTGRAPPRNTTVDLSHIETPVNMTHWPLFHNGVAAGLRIANVTQLDSAWIMYNRPKTNELTNEHAGFLMGLGLNGHLCSLATLNVHDYLVRGHEMTSVGLLLGIAAGKRGSMDATTTRLLSIHVAALLPPTSTELDVPHNVQVAAIMGIGLNYQSTANRHIAEILLQEIGRPPGPEMENCTDRESYSLASGLALGLVMLGRGSEEMVLSELNMSDELYHYMVGGHRRPLIGAYRERYRSPSYQIREGDAVNVDVTSPGATLALGMMFFNTSNSAVAEWLTAPDTQFLLDFVRPDFLMLRIISKGLVMWDKVSPTEEWIESNLPEIVARFAFKKMSYIDDPDCDIDFETMSQAYCNIVAGACMALGLKFAGTSNQAAFHCLNEMVKKMLKLMSKPLLTDQAGKSTVENSLVVIVLSLAMVTAGTGNLDVLRLCRHLRARVGQTYSHVLYGSHMAISMAVGLLFMGGGRYTLSTNPEAVATMLCAFFPKFPIHSNDNRYHLQAFRHLYVLAAQPRVLVPRDVNNGLPCYVPLEIIFKTGLEYMEQSFQAMAPWFLPELDTLREVRVLGPRYWPITFHRAHNWQALVRILKGTGNIYVKQRAGHLSYASDPKGYHSVLAKCLSGEQSIGRSIKTTEIKSFSSDPRILAFAEYFCTATEQKEQAMLQFMSRVLYESVSQEKLDILPLYITLQKLVDSLQTNVTSVDLWQLKLMSVFYERLQQSPGGSSISGLNKPGGGYIPRDTASTDSPGGTMSQLVSHEFIVSLHNSIQNMLHTWTQVHTEVLLSYFSGQSVCVVDTRQLATFLTWYDVPHPALLGQLGIKGESSFPELFKGLQPLGLSLPATMAIASALQRVTS